MRYDDGIEERTEQQIQTDRDQHIQEIIATMEPAKNGQTIRTPTARDGTAEPFKQKRWTVQCIDYPDRIYTNADDAGASVGRSGSAIKTAIKTTGKCGRLRWRYVDARRHKRPDMERPILVAGKLYADAGTAMTRLGICEHTIRRGLSRGYMMVRVPVRSVDPSKFPIEATDAA